MSTACRALVYGDVDLNILDGSAVWLTATATAFADAGCKVTVVLKASEKTDRLTRVLREHPGIEVVAPLDDPTFAGTVRGPRLTPPAFLDVAAGLDAAARFDLFVIRGSALASAAAADPRVRGRLWTYLTDIPQHAAELTAEDVERLTAVAEASRLLLCQTEELRSLLEAFVPAVGGRCVLLPPVVPSLDGPGGDDPGGVGGIRGEDDDRTPGPSRDDLRLVYLGKFARRWNTVEMCELPALLAERGLTATLEVIGDKFHAGDEVMPDFPERMRAALEHPGVVWRGGMPRAEAMDTARRAHVGLSWRSPELDASLELSTKVLEYGALGLPVILNRTPAHERLLGTDYPGFVNDLDEVVAALDAFATDADLYVEASTTCRAAAASYDEQSAVRRVRALVERVFPTPRAAWPARDGRPTRIVVASHDLKFFTAIQDHLAALPEVEVRVDAWPSLRQHDPAVSRELAAWADVVVCEWAGPNAAWYARHKRPGQRLVVRLHRVELYSGLTDDIAIEQVDRVVCVSPHYARLTRELTGWPADKVVVIPNAVDVDAFARDKLPGAAHHLGLIGASPRRKRLDLALDVLDQVRAVDPRFRLFIRSKMPWEQPWVWRDDEERGWFEQQFARIRSTPRLRDAVVLDGFGADVPSWLRGIGHVLSTSDDESFHLSPAEGMASGAQPLVRPWEGADTIYDPAWIAADPTTMARRVVEAARQPGRFVRIGREARRTVREAFGLDVVLDAWERVLVGDEVPARDAGCLMAAPQLPQFEAS